MITASVMKELNFLFKALPIFFSIVFSFVYLFNRFLILKGSGAHIGEQGNGGRGLACPFLKIEKVLLIFSGGIEMEH